ncbi:MAG: tRNA (adenosine(37)-N6)-threonylcarbamoyltransferase complex ATPase subunit type 1 TsaE [Chloroflexota bacterium]
MTISLQVPSRSPAQTRRLGACLGKLLRPGDVLLLQGPFGSGKTTLVQGIAKGLGVRGRVTSPSFALVNEYRADEYHMRVPIYHIDVYRIASPEEALQFGLDEYLSERAISLVEWAERVEDVVPEHHLWVMLRVTGAQRRLLSLQAYGERYERLLEEFGAQCGGLS